MSEISIVAINLAKNSFQVCGVRSDGVVMCNRAVSRGRLVQLLRISRGVLSRWRPAPRRTIGPHCDGTWSRCSADSGKSCEALREAPEERLCRCGRHRSGGIPAQQELRSCDDCREEGAGLGIPDASVS